MLGIGSVSVYVTAQYQRCVRIDLYDVLFIPDWKDPAEPNIKNMICPVEDVAYTLTNSRTGEYEVYLLLEGEEDDDDNWWESAIAFRNRYGFQLETCKWSRCNTKQGHDW